MAGLDNTTFGALWLRALGDTAVWTLLAYAFAMAAFAVFDEVSNQGASLEVVVLSVVSGLIWTPAVFVLTGWAVLPVLTTVIAAVRYFRQQKHP